MPAVRPRESPQVPRWLNEVRLRGTLSAGPEPVELPSGDPLWRFRVCVERPGRATGRRQVDAIDCVTPLTKVSDRLARVATGEEVELSGTLHRRFWRRGGAVASRYEVSVTKVVVPSARKAAVGPTVSRRRTAGSPGPTPASE